jgi:hypothetical protein
MEIKKRIIRKLAITGIFMLTVLQGFSQYTNTLYFMKGVPQVYQVNPAFQPGCKFFLGLPSLSPLQLWVQNEPIALKDVLFPAADGKLYTFLHTEETTKTFLGVLNNKNFINMDIGIPLASIGFGNLSTGSFVAFDITQRVSTNFTYPKGLIEFPIRGPREGMHFDFNGFGVNAMVYTELAMNVSQKIGEKVTVGWRGKILLGQMNLSSTKFDVTLETSQKEWVAHSNIVLDATLPFMDVKYDANGKINLDSISLKEPTPTNIPKMVFNPQNSGFAMDLGVDVRPMEWLQVSASVVDFGSIKWRDQVYNMSGGVDKYVFNGLNVSLNGTEAMQPLLDTLNTFTRFSSTNNPYRTWLPTKVYLGAAVYVHPKISFGVLSRSEFYQSTLRQQFTMSANLYPIRMISTSFTYSVMEGSYKNVGFGLALKAFPFNFYIITDTGPSIYFWPTEAKYLNLRLGMNIMMGGKKKKQAPKYDMPLLY